MCIYFKLGHSKNNFMYDISIKSTWHMFVSQSLPVPTTWLPLLLMIRRYKEREVNTDKHPSASCYSIQPFQWVGFGLSYHFLWI
jgi:hypothetical protein